MQLNAIVREYKLQGCTILNVKLDAITKEIRIMCILY